MDVTTQDHKYNNACGVTLEVKMELWYEVYTRFDLALRTIRAF